MRMVRTNRQLHEECYKGMLGPLKSFYKAKCLRQEYLGFVAEVIRLDTE